MVAWVVAGALAVGCIALFFLYFSTLRQLNGMFAALVMDQFDEGPSAQRRRNFVDEARRAAKATPRETIRHVMHQQCTFVSGGALATLQREAEERLWKASR